MTLYTTAFNEDDGPSVSIDGFCELEDFSLATYHKLKKLGLAPREMCIPGLSRTVRITAKARREWHEKMAQLQEDQAEVLKQESAHRRAIATVAARSPNHISKIRKRRASAS